MRVSATSTRLDDHGRTRLDDHRRPATGGNFSSQPGMGAIKPGYEL